jgi:predicted O-methyltransferase YrrM
LERAALAKWASGRCRAAEIGVYEGRTTRVIAEVLADGGGLFAIDPFFPGRLGICWSKLVARQHLRASPCWSRVRWVEHLSHEAVHQVHGELDFLFIDGDHSLEAIQRDWRDWSCRIARGGIVALHDTRAPPHNPRVGDLGSCRYFASHIRHDPRFELLEQVDSLSVLRCFAPESNTESAPERLPGRSNP